MARFNMKKYRNSVHLAYQSIEEALRSISFGGKPNGFKSFVCNLYNPNVKEVVLLKEYKKIQSYRKKAELMKELNPHLANNSSLIELAQVLKTVSERFSSLFLARHKEDFSMHIENYLEQSTNPYLMEDFLANYPYYFFPLEKTGQLFLQNIVQYFIMYLKEHVTSSHFDYLDNLLYYDRILTFYFDSYFSFLTLTQKRELLDFFLKEKNEALCSFPLGVSKERFSYFLNRYIGVFSQAIQAELEGNDYTFSLENETEDLFYQYMIEKKFNCAVLKEANMISLGQKSLPTAEKNLGICTIDADTTKIYDDGFSISFWDGVYHLRVCIADPLYWVPGQSIIYDEAIKRSTSISVDRTAVLMMPEGISKDIGNLKMGNRRSSIVCHFDIDAVYKEILSFNLKRESVWVKKNYTYSEFNSSSLEKQEDLEGLNLYELLFQIVPILKRFYQMDATYQELFRTNSNVSSTNITQKNNAADAVEAMMVFTNTHVAAYCLQNGIPIIYRNHYMTNERQILINHLETSISRESDKQAKERKRILLQSLYSKSEYGTSNLGHMGIGVDYYTHFTSPNRRGVDLHNHYVLQKCYFENNGNRYDAYMKEQSKIVASYTNSKAKTLDMFAEEYRRILHK